MDKIKQDLKEIIRLLNIKIDRLALESEDTYQSFKNGHELARIAGAKIGLQMALEILEDARN